MYIKKSHAGQLFETKLLYKCIKQNDCILFEIAEILGKDIESTRSTKFE